MDNSLIINGTLMFKDIEIAKIKNDIVIVQDNPLLPTFFKYRSDNIDLWLKERIFDSSRTNVRLLRKILNLRVCPSKEIGIRFHGITLTDCYWIKLENENLKYKQVSSLSDRLSKSALNGIAFEDFTGNTPEVTNLGSFEKCWVNKNDSWYLEKIATDTELFSEILTFRIGTLLGFPMAQYKYDETNNCVSSKDFTNGCKEFFLDEMKNYLDDDEDYFHNVEFISKLDKGRNLVKQYLDIIFMDTLIYNFDRHTGNYGFLRSCKTGEILSLAPNYDNNNALIAKEYREECNTPAFLIDSFLDVAKKYKYEIPDVDFSEADKIIDTLINELSIYRKNIRNNIDSNYVKKFLRNNYNKIKNCI